MCVLGDYALAVCSGNSLDLLEKQQVERRRWWDPDSLLLMEIALITDIGDGTSMKSIAIAGGKFWKVNHVTYIE
jgi:hypothetical protein